MQDVRILFMGTPLFAAKILEYLLENEVNVIGVVTQPDRQKDRKGNLLPTEVKEVALKNGLDVFQHEKINKDLSFLEKFKPDLIITAAFGQIVSQEILDYPKYGCINVHGSLLPKYRGGAPIHYAILNGDQETGVTIMEMVKKMDAGNIISQESFPILEDDTLEEVHDKMVGVAKSLLINTLPKIVDQSYEGIVQDESLVTYSPVITKDEQLIDWNESLVNIYNKIRAFNPWPVAYSTVNDLRFKFYKTRAKAGDFGGEVGEIIDITDEAIIISVNNGCLEVYEFQIQGKRRMKVSEFVNGNNFLFVGDKFQ